ncbi:M23 family peptidase [Desulfovibrionales bacterium]
MPHPSSHRPGLFIVGFLLTILALLGIAYAFFLDRNDPLIVLSPATSTVSKALELTLEVKDQGMGIALIRVEARRKDSIPIKLLEKNFLPPKPTIIERFTLAGLPWKSGEITLEVTARDASWAKFFRGNKSVVLRELTLDNTPPMLSVINCTTNVRQGSAAVVAFTANEELTITGVRVNDIFYPAFRQKKGNYLSLFAFPWNLSAREFQPVLFGRDIAGNEREMHLTMHTLPANFRHDTINLSDSFLDRKMPEFEKDVSGTMSNIDRYLQVNNKLRNANAKTIAELGWRTAAKPLWQGPFQRFTGKLMANFADTRTYRYNGKDVDTQTHLGVDIASQKNIEVSAANYGIVVQADWLGIYGQTVIIDHGLGLQSLYSHLSEIMVKKDDEVQKGQTIGRTGTTGLAGGDHLHFGILISGLAVSPTEWWDPHWIKDNLADCIPDIRPCTTDNQTTINNKAKNEPTKARGKSHPSKKLGDKKY